MSDHETNSDSTEFNIADAIANVEASLEKIKQRHQQIREDQIRKNELENRQQEIKELKKENNHQDSIKSELHYIEEELTQIEMRLESELFKWSSLIEPFWLMVRFGGIGVIIGWILKTINS
ncbi:hypothetical protein GM3708_582 [Geminocystis sp. NIES-3708]|uniref:hypothetical protein n=1 Tax=Geminocystis sp. NIES-3708 TaxID=1615909 RepID=UPI0005FCBE5E|nr:hypothetical protein [Geminocystis sp. NIES-3708]BAQ60176.1 hypothetical protein GM3708_582 [Geminocystis sp. NIES-3708]